MQESQAFRINIPLQDQADLWGTFKNSTATTKAIQELMKFSIVCTGY